MLQTDPNKTLNDFAVFMSYKMTDIARVFFFLPPYYNQIAFFTGNQFGKTGLLCYEKILRAFGSHPVPEKNYLYFECANGHTFGRPGPWPGLHHFGVNPGECFYLLEDKKKKPRKTIFPQDMICPFCQSRIQIHERKTSIYRLCSENLPFEKEGEGADSGEIKNRTYPELKKWLPPFLVKKEISQRNPSLRTWNLNGGCTFGSGENAVFYPGKDILFEFASYSQVLQGTAGVQRLSVFCDEEPPQNFYEEQMARLVAENGDFQIGLTPAIKTSYTFDIFFEEAGIIIRSQAVCDFYGRIGEDDKVKNVEKFPERQSYKAIFQAATDDNPTLSINAINRTLNFIDEDTEATRRYGIHKQATGRILKDFSIRVHVINADDYFSYGRPPLYWTHFRGIDYHPKTPWACGCCTLSPKNELFIWYGRPISPDKFTTYQIMEQFYHACGDYTFKLNLVDPESETIKKDRISIYSDMNRVSLELKREGIGTGGYWQTWDTKNDYGRDKIKERLKNSRHTGRPFNNEIVEGGKTIFLPTLWIVGSDDTRYVIESMQKWSWEQWADSNAAQTKDDKNVPQQKWSHMNMVFECLHKHPGFRFTRSSDYQERDYGSQYFKSARGR